MRTMHKCNSISIQMTSPKVVRLTAPLVVYVVKRMHEEWFLIHEKNPRYIATNKWGTERSGVDWAKQSRSETSAYAQQACVVSQGHKGDFRISTPQVVSVDVSWNSTRDGSQWIRVRN